MKFKTILHVKLHSSLHSLTICSASIGYNIALPAKGPKPREVGHLRMPVVESRVISLKATGLCIS